VPLFSTEVLSISAQRIAFSSVNFLTRVEESVPGGFKEGAF
jgi:hypothetical protein